MTRLTRESLHSLHYRLSDWIKLDSRHQWQIKTMILINGKEKKEKKCSFRHKWVQKSFRSILLINLILSKRKLRNLAIRRPIIDSKAMLHLGIVHQLWKSKEKLILKLSKNLHHKQEWAANFIEQRDPLKNTPVTPWSRVRTVYFTVT